MPQLTKTQLNVSGKYLEEYKCILNKQWNELITRISLKIIVFFSQYHILSNINTQQMQNIIMKYYTSDCDIIQTFQNSIRERTLVDGCAINFNWF